MDFPKSLVAHLQSDTEYSAGFTCSHGRVFDCDNCFSLLSKRQRGDAAEITRLKVALGLAEQRGQVNQDAMNALKKEAAEARADATYNERYYRTLNNTIETKNQINADLRTELTELRSKVEKLAAENAELRTAAAKLSKEDHESGNQQV